MQRHSMERRRVTVALVPSSPADLIEGWFASLYRDCEGWLTIFAIDKQTGHRHTEWVPVDEPGQVASIAVKHAPRCDVWFGVATRKERLSEGKRGGASDCLHIPAMWADIDILGHNHSAADLPPDLDAARLLLADYPMPPSVTVHSGGGLQPYWVLSEPLEASEVGDFLDRWGYTWTTYAERHGWHVDNVWDVARVLRVPGTQNRKHEPIDVTILELNKGRRYGLDDLDQWVFDPPVKETSSDLPRVPYIGPQRPGDAFNAVRDGATILESAGFTLEQTDSNGDRHYHAPGAANATGATVYAEDGHTTIWSETAAARWPSLQVRRPYDPFGLYSHLNHGGNWVAASDELARQGYGKKHVGELPAIVGSPTAAVDPAESSWRERDLGPVLEGILSGDIQRPTPTIGTRTDGKGLFYAGRTNALWGESGDGKSWAALYACKQQIDLGNHVFYVDYEDNEIGIASRLMQLGLAVEAITTNLHYFWPDAPATLDDLDDLKKKIRDYRPTLTVIDSAGESMAIDGVKPNDDDAVARWFRVLPSLFARAGSAVIVIDHVTKDREGRGLYAIGSQRKRAAVNGAAYMVEAIKPFGMEMAGLSRLVVAKDRNGNYLRGHKVAEFHLDCTNGTQASLVAPEAPGDFRPTVLMERTSRVLEELPEPTSQRKLQMLVVGKNDNSKSLALERLVKEGYVEKRPTRKGFEYVSLAPFREGDELENLVEDAFNERGER